MNKKQEIVELQNSIRRREYEIESYRREVMVLNQQIAKLKRDLAEVRMRHAAALESSK